MDADPDCVPDADPEYVVSVIGAYINDILAKDYIHVAGQDNKKKKISHETVKQIFVSKTRTYFAGAKHPSFPNGVSSTERTRRESKLYTVSISLKVPSHGHRRKDRGRREKRRGENVGEKRRALSPTAFFTSSFVFHKDTRDGHVKERRRGWVGVGGGWRGERGGEGRCVRVVCVCVLCINISQHIQQSMLSITYRESRRVCQSNRNGHKFGPHVIGLIATILGSLNFDSPDSSYASVAVSPLLSTRRHCD